MIAIDTNLLIYAHRRDTRQHEASAAALRTLAEGTGAWAIPWPCIHEFLAVATNARMWKAASTALEAVRQVQAWRTSESLVFLAETDGYWEVLGEILATSRVAGPTTHDARIAALCRLHGVRELWTADRDFSRFPGLTVRNPLTGS